MNAEPMTAFEAEWNAACLAKTGKPWRVIRNEAVAEGAKSVREGVGLPEDLRDLRYEYSGLGEDEYDASEAKDNHDALDREIFPEYEPLCFRQGFLDYISRTYPALWDHGRPDDYYANDDYIHESDRGLVHAASHADDGDIVRATFLQVAADVGAIYYYKGWPARIDAAKELFQCLDLANPDGTMGVDIYSIKPTALEYAYTRACTLFPELTRAPALAEYHRRFSAPAAAAAAAAGGESSSAILARIRAKAAAAAGAPAAAGGGGSSSYPPRAPAAAAAGPADDAAGERAYRTANREGIDAKAATFRAGQPDLVGNMAAFFRVADGLALLTVDGKHLEGSDSLLYAMRAIAPDVRRAFLVGVPAFLDTIPGRIYDSERVAATRFEVLLRNLDRLPAAAAPAAPVAPPAAAARADDSAAVMRFHLDNITRRFAIYEGSAKTKNTVMSFIDDIIGFMTRAYNKEWVIPGQEMVPFAARAIPFAMRKEFLSVLDARNALRFPELPDALVKRAQKWVDLFKLLDPPYVEHDRAAAAAAGGGASSYPPRAAAAGGSSLHPPLPIAFGQSIQGVKPGDFGYNVLFAQERERGRAVQAMSAASSPAAAPAPPRGQGLAAIAVVAHARDERAKARIEDLEASFGAGQAEVQNHIQSHYGLPARQIYMGTLINHPVAGPSARAKVIPGAPSFASMVLPTAPRGYRPPVPAAASSSSSSSSSSYPPLAGRPVVPGAAAEFAKRRRLAELDAERDRLLAELGEDDDEEDAPVRSLRRRMDEAGTHRKPEDDDDDDEDNKTLPYELKAERAAAAAPSTLQGRRSG